MRIDVIIKLCHCCFHRRIYFFRSLSLSLSLSILQRFNVIINFHNNSYADLCVNCIMEIYA